VEAIHRLVRDAARRAEEDVCRRDGEFFHCSRSMSIGARHVETKRMMASRSSHSHQSRG